MPITSTAPAASAPVARTRPRLVLAICCMSLLLVSLDNTIVNVALPSIHRDLGASLSQLQWTLDVHGRAGDPSDPERLDRRPDRAASVFHSRSRALLGRLAPVQPRALAGWLIAFRALQGVGGSMLNPVAMSIIRNIFTDPRERAQAIGVWGGVVGISMALGPVAGRCARRAGWRSIFLDQRADRPPRDRPRGSCRAGVARGPAARLDPVGQVLASSSWRR